MYKFTLSCYYWPAGAKGLRLRTLTIKENFQSGRPTNLEQLASSIERRKTRRLKAKCEVQLAATLSLLDNDVTDVFPTLVFLGRTSDLSAAGLAMVLPATTIDERFCSGSNKLKLSLYLPEAVVDLEVSPVRCERLTDPYSVQGYLLGTRITNVEHREPFEQYLERLSGAVA